MAIHWQVKFRSLRAETLYTVNIYDDSYTGDPVQLTGAAQPFTTDEDDDDDLFAPVRTQSGYIRIVDTGKDNNGNTFDWRTFIPTTDTDRPVSLQHEENGSMVVDWQGYLQAQNFGGDLFIPTQVREFPVQCMLSVLSRMDIDTGRFATPANFAALLYYIIGTIPTFNFDKIMIQGGADAQAWLLKRFDWTVFCEVSDGGTFDSKYDVLTVLEEMCRYWGWIARTYRQTLWLVSPDDTSIPDFLELTGSQLETMAGGTAAGTINTSGYSSVSIGDVFASVHNKDTQVRGANHASLTAETGNIDDEIVFCYPDSVMKTMYDRGFEWSSVLYDYTYDLNSFIAAFMSGDAQSNGSFNIMRLRALPNRKESAKPVIRMKAAYGGSDFATLQSTRAHVFTDGVFSMEGTVWQNGEQFEDADEYPPYWGNKHMTMRLGIGLSRASARWWDGTAWQYTQCTFYAKIGGKGNTIFTCKEKGAGKTVYWSIGSGNTPMSGYIFIDFLGSDDINDDATKRAFDLAEFSIRFQRTDELWRYSDPDRYDAHEYTAKNDQMLNSEWSGSTMFATEDYSKFGPGVVTNPDLSYFKGWDYENHEDANIIDIPLPVYQPIVLNTPTQPEQHLVNRIVKFWSQSRRMIECELQQQLLPVITPFCKVVVDGTTLYPYTINHDYRNDVVKLINVEI